jgi:lambda family phage minor tail protein L
MAVPFSELQKVAPSAVIELFELQLDTVNHGVNDIYRFHAGANLNANGQLVWAGNTYLRFPVEADSFEYSGQGQLPRPKIRVSNIMGTITALLLSLPSGLERAKVTRIRTLARYLDAVNFPGSVNPYGTPDPTAEFPREIYYIDRKASETREVVEFELAAAFDLTGVRGPKRQCISSICQWKYRSAECGYTAAAYYDTNDQPVATLALDACGKRLSSCETRFDLYTRTGGSVTSGSNILTLPSTLSILPGEPVRGWGIPVGTTVAAITSGTTLQLSANANKNSSVTVNGTPSATGAFMTVTSSAGLSVGMTVNGPLMNGATITGITGTTITLSQRPYKLVKDGIYKVQIGDDYVDFATGTTGIIVGMYAFGPFALSKPVITVEPTRVRIDTVNSIKALYEEPLQLFTTLLSKKNSIDNKPVTVYFVDASPATTSYTFTANSIYSFRDSGAVLPFGSFPGVGSYTS